MSEVDEIREWNAACVRLEDFLRAHRIEDRSRHVELVAELLSAARLANPSGVGATERVMAEADARVEGWFAGLIEGGDSDRGRAAYYSTGVYQRWPGAFLREEVPEEMREAVRSVSVQAGPDLEFSSLIRKEINYGPMEDLARETWETLSWGKVLRAFLIWAGVFVAVYGFYLGYLA